MLKLFVGYSTRPVENLDELVPKFEANRTLKDPVKIKEDLKEKEKTWRDTSHLMPYTGTFNEVFISNPAAESTSGHVLQWLYHPPVPGKPGKPRVSVSVRNYLLNTYPDAWSWDTHATSKPRVCFFGFELRLFLKILGIECAIPSCRSPRPAPAQLWYGNADHRDMAEAILPNPYDKRWPLRMAVEQFRPVEGIEDISKWDVLLNGWTGPGVSPQKDAGIAFCLADQLGFLEDLG